MLEKKDEKVIIPINLRMLATWCLIHRHADKAGPLATVQSVFAMASQDFACWPKYC